MYNFTKNKGGNTMKAIIEKMPDSTLHMWKNKLKNEGEGVGTISRLIKEFKMDMKDEFFYILNRITEAPNVEALRKEFPPTFGYDHFKFGFGSSHMWVHQKAGTKVDPDRLIFVKL